MWYAELTRRELLDVCLGHAAGHGVVQSTSSVVSTDPKPGTSHVYWSERPTLLDQLPALIIVPDNEFEATFAALIASPLAPSPLTASCRVITSYEASVRFDHVAPEPSELTYAVISALALTESMLLSGGKFNVNSWSSAACSRTLSFAWGRTLSNGGASEALAKLVPRWMESYATIHSAQAVDDIRPLLTNVIRTLTIATQIGTGMRTSGKAGALAEALVFEDVSRHEHAWMELTRNASTRISLRELAAATREDRGMYLQAAIHTLGRGNYEEEAFATCAFLATRVAPGSLEHMELLTLAGGAELALWYTLFSVLQSPQQLLSTQGGIGARVMRLLSRREDPSSRPTGDVSFRELIAFSKIGMESISRRANHSNELQVEILPFVTTSFTLAPRGSRHRPNDEAAQMSLVGMQKQNDATLLSPTQKMDAALSILNDLRKEIKDWDKGHTPAQKRSRKK